MRLLTRLLANYHFKYHESRNVLVVFLCRFGQRAKVKKKFHPVKIEARFTPWSRSFYLSRPRSIPILGQISPAADPTTPPPPLLRDWTPVWLRILFCSNDYPEATPASFVKRLTGGYVKKSEGKCERSQCSNIHIARTIAHAPAPFHPPVGRFQ